MYFFMLRSLNEDGENYEEENLQPGQSESKVWSHSSESSAATSVDKHRSRFAFSMLKHISVLLNFLPFLFHNVFCKYFSTFVFLSSPLLNSQQQRGLLRRSRSEEPKKIGSLKNFHRSSYKNINCKYLISFFSLKAT